MASSKDRQRKLARAKLDRQMARRAAATHRTRRIQAGVGAGLALVLIVLGTVWLLGGFDPEKKDTAAENQVCLWAPQNANVNTNLKDVGTPPTTGIPTAGTRPMTITTNQGEPITVALDLASAPCAGASFTYLAGKAFFDNTTCHEITDEGALRCGDPSGTGQGGPTYSFFENLPVPEPTPSTSPSAAAETAPLYPAGTVALIGSPPGNNGSQFLVFFKDFNPPDPAYPVVGTVTGGLDVVKRIGAMQTVEDDSGAKVKPKADVVIQSLTVSDVQAGAPAASQPATATPAAGASTTATPTTASQS